MGFTVCLTLKGVRSPDLVCTTNHVKADACGSHAAVVVTIQASHQLQSAGTHCHIWKLSMAAVDTGGTTV